MSALKEQPAPTATLDDVRNYWDSRPCNIRHSTKPIGSREYFDEVEARKHFVEPHIPDFAQFERWAGKRVLEVGCGIGTAAINFARAGADYTGVDLSQASLDLAIKRFDVYGLKGQFLPCNAEELSSHFDPESFDLVYSFGVIHHTPNQRRVVEEIRKVVKLDGEFRCMLYAKHSWKDAMIEAGLDQPEAQFGCPIATTYTFADVRQLINGLFDLAYIEHAHIFPYIVEKYVKYEYEVQPWFRAMPEAMFKALEKRFGWHLLFASKPV
jgi:ubiquinone/menaquinone biosynthesis C-methylase UbiE